jgi:hypothetical protein
MRKILSCLTLLGVAACAGPPPAPLGPPIVIPSGPGLSAAEVREVIAGNTGTGIMSGSQAEYSMYVAPDGTAQAKLPTGIDQGAWTLTADGQWCARWQRFRSGEEYCQKVYKQGEIYKFVNSNSVELLVFAPGKRF